MYSQNQKMVVEKFRRVLERSREFNISINPEKYRIGVEEVTDVGHLMNKYGIHFSRE